MTQKLKSSIELYTGTDAEQKGLEKICHDGSIKDFWPAREFYVSLRIPGTFLLYTHEGEIWTGLALGRVVAAEAELFYIYTHSQWRRKGLGELLLAVFIDHAREQLAAERVFLEVRMSNLGAIKLYEKLGFVAVGKRTKYYQDGEDAAIYERSLHKGS